MHVIGFNNREEEYGFLKTNITQNMGRPHCAATLILILL